MKYCIVAATLSVALAPQSVAQSLDKAHSSSEAPVEQEQTTARGMKITTGITWDSPTEDDGEMQKNSLNFKPRTQVGSMAELDRFLTAQLKKDEISRASWSSAQVIVSFFEPD